MVKRIVKKEENETQQEISFGQYFQGMMLASFMIQSALPTFRVHHKNEITNLKMRKMIYCTCNGLKSNSGSSGRRCEPYPLRMLLPEKERKT